MEITVFSDCHWHGPTPVKVEPKFGDNVFYIGDNHELKNIQDKKVSKYTKEYLNFLDKCKSTNTLILNGNHEVSLGYKNNNIEVLLPTNKSIALVHFHRESWSTKDINIWHNMDPGKAKLKLLAIKIKNIVRNKLGRSDLKKKHINICFEIAEKYNVKNIVFGHTHPKKLIIENHRGITMVNVPRGKTSLFYNENEQLISQ